MPPRHRRPVPRRRSILFLRNQPPRNGVGPPPLLACLSLSNPWQPQPTTPSARVAANTRSDLALKSPRDSVPPLTPAVVVVLLPALLDPRPPVRPSCSPSQHHARHDAAEPQRRPPYSWCSPFAAPLVAPNPAPACPRVPPGLRLCRGTATLELACPTTLEAKDSLFRTLV